MDRGQFPAGSRLLSLPCFQRSHPSTPKLLARGEMKREDAENMRLRLVVRRHALPEVRVVFKISLGNEPTIAKLLEQVNEIVPLASTDWGLEDYVVELIWNGRPWECLHFQPASGMLKEDEEIM